MIRDIFALLNNSYLYNDTNRIIPISGSIDLPVAGMRMQMSIISKSYSIKVASAHEQIKD